MGKNGALQTKLKVKMNKYIATSFLPTSYTFVQLMNSTPAAAYSLFGALSNLARWASVLCLAEQTCIQEACAS